MTEGCSGIVKRNAGIRIKFFFQNHPLILPLLLAVAAVVAVDHKSLIGLSLVFLFSFCALLIRQQIFWLSLISLIAISGMHACKVDTRTKISEQFKIAQKQRISGVVVKKLSSHNYVIRSRVNGIGPNIRILYYAPKGYFLGDRVEGEVWLRKPQRARNPGSFNKSEWLSRIGVFVEAKGKLELSGINSIYRSLEVFPKLKEIIKKRLAYGIEESDSAKIIHSMFLGEKFANEDFMVQDFRLSGTMHVFAVSGLHVMLVAGITLFFLRILGLPKLVVIPFVVIVMVVYTGVTGWGSPAVRASVMGALFLSGPLFYRNSNILNSLAASALIVLMFDSSQLFTIGFQLTYLVVVSIVLFTRFWQHQFSFIDQTEPFLPYSLYSAVQRFSLNIRSKIKDSLAVSFSAWMASTPLIVSYFKIFSPIALLVGVPVVVLLTCIMWLAVSSLLVGALWNTGAVAINRINAGFANWTHKVVEKAADVKYGHCILSQQPHESIEVLDVKGGAAVYLNIGRGFMLDAGGKSSIAEVREAIRQFNRGVNQIWISHQDSNHYRGIDLITRDYCIEKIGIPKLQPSRQFNAVIKNAEFTGAVVETLREGSVFEEDICRLEVVYDGVQRRGSESDDRALVFCLNWRDTKFLFVNDIGFYSEKKMLELGVDVSCDVLICGKHRDQQSMSAEFLNAVDAKVIIATSFKYAYSELRNFAWVQRVKKTGVKLFLQTYSGAVSIRHTGDKIEFVSMLNGSFTLPVQ